MFKKGNKFGHGRPKLPIEIVKARKLNKIESEKIINRFLEYSITDLDKYLDNDENPVLEMFICRILKEGIKNGDHQKLEWVFQRLIGKVSEHIKHELPKPTMIKLIGEDAVVMLGAQSEGDDDENNS